MPDLSAPAQYPARWTGTVDSSTGQTFTINPAVAQGVRAYLDDSANDGTFEGTDAVAAPMPRQQWVPLWVRPADGADADDTVTVKSASGTPNLYVEVF